MIVMYKLATKTSNVKFTKIMVPVNKSWNHDKLQKFKTLSLICKNSPKPSKNLLQNILRCTKPRKIHYGTSFVELHNIFLFPLLLPRHSDYKKINTILPLLWDAPNFSKEWDYHFLKFWNSEHKFVCIKFYTGTSHLFQFIYSGFNVTTPSFISLYINIQIYLHFYIIRKINLFNLPYFFGNSIEVNLRFFQGKLLKRRHKRTRLKLTPEKISIK